MKKTLVLMLSIVTALILTVSVYAGEGSDTVGDGKLQPELRYSYMQTKLKTDLLLLNAGEYNLTMHDVYLQLNWGLHPNVDIYGIVGARFDSLDADIATLALGFAPIDINAKYDNSANFLYGLGMKATFYRSDNGFYIGGGLLFTHSLGGSRDLKLSGTVLGADLATLVGDFPTKIDTRMITLTPDIHLGWHFKNIGLTPYFGVEYRWAWAEASYDLGQFAPLDSAVAINFEQEDPFGIFVGLDYSVNDRLYFNVEGNMLNRWGVSASIGYLFDIDGKMRSAAPSPFLGGGGAGSDTVGDCRLLPQVRYSYMQTTLETDFPLLDAGEYDLTTHDIYAQINWGLHPNVDLYGIVGARIESLDADVATLAFGFAPVDINAKYDNSAGFLYGLGAKATFYRSDSGFYIGGGLLFTHSFGEGRDLKLSGTVLGADVAEEVGDFPTKINTSMVTLTPDIHVGWHFKNIGLTPYFGVEYRWAWAKAAYEFGQFAPIDADVELNFHQKDSVGIFAGLDYYVNDRLYFNVEGNVLDRWGVSAGFGYLFDICEKPKPAPVAPAPVIEPKLEPMTKN